MENATESTGIYELAKMPRETVIDLPALARLFGRCEKSIARAIQRNELPAPMKFLGKRSWTIGALVDFLSQRQADALKHAQQHAARLAKHSA